MLCSPSLAILVAMATLSTLTHATNATFYPTMNMTDTSGNPIQAHGGVILQSVSANDSNWYWFGEDKTGETTSGTFIGVSCYRSSDFSSWESLGRVLTPIAGTNISHASVVERPKVIYNDLNDEYVMWFHSDNSSYGAAMVGVATSKTIDGQYSWRGSFKPFGNDSRDETVWKDPDTGIAYLVFATTDNADLEVASLDADYYNVAEGLYTWPNVYWEAPGVFKIDGVFYLFYSRQNGWTPTDNYYITASNMSGPWSDPTLLAPADAYAYLTQNAYDITINGSQAITYLYYGDHWSGNFLSTSTYAFYPLIYGSGSVSLHKTGGWTLDTATGAWSDLPYTAITAAESMTDNSTLVPCLDNCSGGLAANMTSDTAFSFTWCGGTAGQKVVSIRYMYAGPANSFRHIGATVDGMSLGGNALLETTMVTNVTQQAPFPMTLEEGSEVVLRLVDFDGDAFWVDGVDVYDFQ